MSAVVETAIDFAHQIKIASIQKEAMFVNAMKAISSQRMEHVKVINSITVATLHVSVNGLTDINECETDNVCQQRCFNRKGSFQCKCLKGYHLMDDKRSCQGKMLLIIESLLYNFLLDIDECADHKSDCDDICINTNGSYSCQCSDGLRLLRDKKSCGGEPAEKLHALKLMCAGIFVYSIIRKLYFW